MPASLVEEMTRVAVLAQQVWGEAKQKSDYRLFEPWLAKTLDLKRQEARCVGMATDGDVWPDYRAGETIAANV